jgi:hypothetical protein
MEGLDLIVLGKVAMVMILFFLMMAFGLNYFIV